MICCVCKNVNDKKVKEAIENGAETIEEIVEETGACTGCKCCKARIESLLSE